MKRNTVIIVAVAFGGILLLFFAMSKSTTLPTTSSTSTGSTVASIFNFATKALDATEKALPKFFKDDSATLTSSDKAQIDSIFGPGNGFTADD